MNNFIKDESGVIHIDKPWEVLNQTKEQYDTDNKAIMALWCSCPSQEYVTYIDDNSSAACDKHHWIHDDCGKIVQIG